MAIIDKNIISQKLETYYKEHFGDSASDIWYENPAVNVRLFERDRKLITLKLNIRDGSIEERSMDKDNA